MSNKNNNILDSVNLNSDNSSDLDDEEQRTIFCANFSSEVTEQLLYELFLQAGPIEKVQIPKESDGKRNKSYAFIIYEHKLTVPYALKLYEGVKLFNRHLDIKLRTKNPKDDNNQQQNHDRNKLYNNLYPTFTEPIMMNQFLFNPTNMTLLNQRYSNPLGFNHFNTVFSNYGTNIDLGLVNNTNLGIDNLNQRYIYYNPELAQELIYLNH